MKSDKSDKTPATSATSATRDAGLSSFHVKKGPLRSIWENWRISVLKTGLLTGLQRLPHIFRYWKK